MSSIGKVKISTGGSITSTDSVGNPQREEVAPALIDPLEISKEPLAVTDRAPASTVMLGNERPPRLLAQLTREGADRFTKALADTKWIVIEAAPPIGHEHGDEPAPDGGEGPFVRCLAMPEGVGDDWWSASALTLADWQALPAMMTIHELADALGIDKKTLYEAFQRNELPGARRVTERLIKIWLPTFLASFEEAASTRNKP